MKSVCRTVTALTFTAMLGAGALAACGSDESSTSAPSVGAIEVSGAWARTSPAVAGAGAAYVSIHNDSATDDALVAARIDASVAKAAEIHETVTSNATGTGMAAETSTAPMMEMRPVDKVAIPARGTLELKPGGYHIMLMNLAKPLESGSSFQLTLTFERSGDKVVTFDVRDAAP